MPFETIFLLIVVLLAFLIILGTGIAVIVVLRRGGGKEPAASGKTGTSFDAETTFSDTPSAQPTHIPTPQEDIDAYMANQRTNLAEFELKDLSNSFKGTTNEGQRQGVILHLTEQDTPIVAFSSQAFGAQNGTVNAETAYGKMELIIAQNKAGVQWEGEPLGILDYGKQRVLGAEGQLLGSMEHPHVSGTSADTYPIAFYGQKVADVRTTINAISTLRWFGGDEAEQLPALDNLALDLDDSQTLLLLAAVLLEVGFFNLA